MSELQEKTDRGTVRVSIGFTKNLGNYNSARIDLETTQPVRPGEEWQDALDREYDEVEQKLIKKLRELEAEIDG